ncbi:cell envelope integrity protein TolA [Fodinicurvata halophila]|uniref:cell envelope integrity protein TolA n=1 Tax=Fodinicurvata halophila TaxID=1419723 RepID=UPI00362BD47A
MTEAGPSSGSWDDSKTKRRALTISLGLHAGLVLLAVFGLPFLHSKPEPVTIVPVEMVSEDDLTSQEIAETTVEDAEETPQEETLEDAPEAEPVQEALPDSQAIQAPEPPSVSESEPPESETAAEAIPEPEPAESSQGSEVAESAPEPEPQRESEVETETQAETEPETTEAETAEDALETAEAVEEETEDRLSEVTPPTPRARPEEEPEDVVEDRSLKKSRLPRSRPRNPNLTRNQSHSRSQRPSLNLNPQKKSRPNLRKIACPRSCAMSRKWIRKTVSRKLRVPRRKLLKSPVPWTNGARHSSWLRLFRHRWRVAGELTPVPGVPRSWWFPYVFSWRPTAACDSHRRFKTPRA